MVQSRHCSIVHSIRDSAQMYPECIVTYTSLRQQPHGTCPNARKYRIDFSFARTIPTTPQCRQMPVVASPQPIAARPAAVAPSQYKLCVVCHVEPVRRIREPCGHLCLCRKCSNEQGLNNLRGKCPECHGIIERATAFYGKLVQDKGLLSYRSSKPLEGMAGRPTGAFRQI